MNSEKLFAGLTFEQAVRRYADTVTAVCVMRLQNYADAEDCFQNTFSKLWLKSPDFQSEEHLKAWLIRVAIHECADYMRKNRRTVPLSPAAEKSDGFSFDRYETGLLLDAINRAKTLYFTERERWDEMVIRDLEKDVSWENSATQYRSLYLELKP